jgi:hypothetical protein
MSRRIPASGGVRGKDAGRRQGRLPAVAALVFLFAGPAARSALARENETVALADTISLDPGVTCLEGLMLTEHVRKWLGSDRIDRRVRIRVLGSKRSAIKAVFIVDKGDGYPTERSFESAPESCIELHSALALSIAMAIKAVRFEAPLREPPEPSAGLRRVATAFQWYVTTGVVNPAFSAVAPVGPSGRFELGWLSWLDARLGIMTTSAYGQRVQTGEDWRYDVNLWAVRGDLCYGADPFENLRSRFCLGSAFGLLKTQGKNVNGIERFVGNAQAEDWAAFIPSIDLAYTGLEVFGLRVGPSIEIDFHLPVWSRKYEVVAQEGSDTSVIAEGVPIIYGVGVAVGLVGRAR